MRAISNRLFSICTLSRGRARQRVRCESSDKRDSLPVIVRMHVLVCLCAAALLIAACQRRETPQWAPNVERTDITPSEWMVGCFAIDPMTDRLRAAGAGDAIELTPWRVDLVKGRERYRAEMNGRHLKHGVWTPVAVSKIRVEVGSEGFGNLTFLLSRGNGRLVGTYQEIGDVSPGFSPDIPVSLRRVTCIPAPGK